MSSERDGKPADDAASLPETAGTPAAAPETAPVPDTMDSALLDMALTLRQLVETLRSAHLDDARLDKVEGRIEALLKRSPNA